MNAPVTAPRSGNFIPQSVSGSYVRWTIFMIICTTLKYRFESLTEYFLKISCTWARTGVMELQAVIEAIEDHFPQVDLNKEIQALDPESLTTEDFIALMATKIEATYGTAIKGVIDIIVKTTDWERFTADTLPMDARLTLDLGNAETDVDEMIMKAERECRVELPEDFFPDTVSELIDAVVQRIS